LRVKIKWIEWKQLESQEEVIREETVESEGNLVERKQMKSHEARE
jgi:hypothetical protein